MDIFWNEMTKEDLTNPKLSNETHFAKTRKTLEDGFQYAVDNYKKQNPMWAGTLEYFLNTEMSKKNIEEYIWI